MAASVLLILQVVVPRPRGSQNSWQRVQRVVLRPVRVLRLQRASRPCAQALALNPLFLLGPLGL